MARNITVYDLDQYPDNSKTVTVDQKQVVPVGAEGDDKWVLSFSTNAYSSIASSTAIQDIYVQEIQTGWAKSSGLTGNTFTLESGDQVLGIKMDGSSQYYIALDAGTNMDGDLIADDIEAKIRAIPDGVDWQSSDDSLAFKNCMVKFENGKFKIISGTVSQYYVGSGKTSVAVTASGADTCYDTLGFNLGINSVAVAGIAVKEALVTSSYTTDNTPLVIGAGTGVQVGDCILITDGTNTDYFTALSGTTDTSVVVPINSTNSFVGIAHSYTANEAKIQILTVQDPDKSHAYYHSTVEIIMRLGIISVTNQMDFSS
jgi:membrane-associated protease RseP (regulator of RpoE activity)